jgi:hypothetical protein
MFQQPGVLSDEYHITTILAAFEALKRKLKATPNLGAQQQDVIYGAVATRLFEDISWRVRPPLQIPAEFSYLAFDVDQVSYFMAYLVPVLILY